jgi:hypothetical protein
LVSPPNRLTAVTAIAVYPGNWKGQNDRRGPLFHFSVETFQKATRPAEFRPAWRLWWKDCWPAIVTLADGSQVRIRISATDPFYCVENQFGDWVIPEPEATAWTNELDRWLGRRAPETASAPAGEVPGKVAQ